MRFLSTLIVLLLAATTVQAQIPSSKGMGEVSYSGWSLDGAEKEQAINQAKVNSIERFIAGGGVSRSKNFDLIRDEVAANPDEFVLGYSIISETDNDDDKKYRVILRSEINASRLDQALQDTSAVGNASAAEKSYMTFVFVARQQTSVKSYDEKRVKRKDSETYVEGSDQQSVSSSGVEYAAGEYESSKTITGGSATQKADVVQYDVSTAQGINSTMTQVLSTAGFEVVEAEYLQEMTGGLVSVDAFREDFRTGSDISAPTKINAAKGAKMVDVTYLALGTLDVGIQDTDPVSGLNRVYVSVNGQVLDVSSRFPKAVASVGPVQYAGVGPSTTVARNNALKKAAEAAGRELTEQMNARGAK